VAALIWINPRHSERFAAIDTAPQLAIGHCPAQTRQPDRRGGPRRSRADNRGRSSQMKTTARMPGRAIGSRSMR